MPRPLYEVAREISSDWKAVDYTAKPYLAAMSDLENINDQYGSDDGRAIVLYFLANAGKWRGGVATRVKAELKQMLGKRASDRSSLIRLASSLPKGSSERKAILSKLAAIKPGDVGLDTVAITSSPRMKGGVSSAWLRPDKHYKPGTYLFMVLGSPGWHAEDFIQGQGPLYLDAGQGWVLDNADELRVEVRKLLRRLQMEGGVSVKAPPPEGDGVLMSARDLNNAASSGNIVRLRQSMSRILVEMTPFCEYLGEGDVADKFRLLAKDLATRG
jgi:hypothetical protein